MFESPSITLAALAARWGCTPQDIAGARPPRAPPLYFAYEGLVFDVEDVWTRDGGDDKAARERQRLVRQVADDEAKIRKWMRAGASEWRKLDSFGKDVGVEDAKSVRLEIENNKTRLRILQDAWEAREVDRARARFIGYLRADANTLNEIEMHGTATFPRFAVYAVSPFHQVALELPRYPKDALKSEDLRAMMIDVRAIESASSTPQEPHVGKRHRIKSRVQFLEAEINLAKLEASDQDDYHSVWTTLKDMALRGMDPFTGMTDPTKGLEYHSAAGSATYFSKEALRKRMSPSAR